MTVNLRNYCFYNYIFLILHSIQFIKTTTLTKNTLNFHTKIHTDFSNLWLVDQFIYMRLISFSIYWRETFVLLHADEFSPFYYSPLNTDESMHRSESIVCYSISNSHRTFSFGLVRFKHRMNADISCRTVCRVYQQWIEIVCSEFSLFHYTRLIQNRFGMLL